MVHACLPLTSQRDVRGVAMLGAQFSAIQNDHVAISSKHKTCRRYNVPGHAHALTFSCYRRQAFLADDHAREWFLDALEPARGRCRFDLWAYEIMPEHVHALIYPHGADYSMARILSALKQPVSKRMILSARLENPQLLSRMIDKQPNAVNHLRFWQRGGGYDRNLWSPKHIWETIDYIHANPVRRGLCDVDTDWEWSSARAYRDDTQLRTTIDMQSLPDDPRTLNMY